MKHAVIDSEDFMKNSILGKPVERILIADDETELAFSIEVALNMAGFITTVCHDGREAMEKITDSWLIGLPYSLIITDIQMPGMTGRELLTELRRRGINTPVMVITGYGEKEMMIELMRNGCGDFLEKPVEMNSLLMNIRRMLEKRRSVGQVEKMASEALRGAEIYKRDFEFLRAQMDSAAQAYHQIVNFDAEGLKVKLAHRFNQHGGLGGDFFGARNTPSGVDLLVADIAGHDMGASYHTVYINSVFDRGAGEPGGGVALMREVNEKLSEPGDFTRMATALSLRMDLEAMAGEIVTAGHNGMIHLRANASGAQIISSGGPALGAARGACFQSKCFSFGPGDRFVIHTDGVINASRVDGRTGARTRLSEAGLLRFIELHRTLPLEDMVGRVWGDVSGYCMRRFTDDALLLAVEIPAEVENVDN